MDEERENANLKAIAESESGVAVAAESVPAGLASTRTIIKAAFRCLGTKYFGAFVLILPDELEPSHSLYQVIGMNPEYGSLAPAMGWHDFCGRLLTYRAQAVAISHNAMAALETALPAEEGFDRLRRTADLGVEMLRPLLGSRLARILGDRACELDVAVERVSREALAGAPSGATSPTEARLHIQLLVDPLNGLPAHRLRPGNKIAVYLLHEEAADHALIDRYQPRDGRGKPLPVIASIISVTDREDETLDFLVAISDGVRGRAVIRKALKVRVAEAIPPGAITAARAESAPTPADAGAPGPPREILLVIFVLELVIFLFLVLIALVFYWR